MQNFKDIKEMIIDTFVNSADAFKVYCGKNKNVTKENFLKMTLEIFEDKLSFV